MSESSYLEHAVCTQVRRVIKAALRVNNPNNATCGCIASIYSESRKIAFVMGTMVIFIFCCLFLVAGY